MHANGRIDLCKNESEIRKIISYFKRFAESDLERIIIKREFIRKVNHVLNSFIEKIEFKDSI